MTKFRERIKRVEEVGKQLQVAYPQYSNKDIEHIFSGECVKSIGKFAFIGVFAEVDCYTIFLYNSIGFKKMEKEVHNIDFNSLYKLIEDFMER